VSADDRSATALTGELIRLLSDREAAQKMGARALEILCKNRGATDCTMAAIKELMKSSKDDWER
jgi:3-deoxy-D-manno-octulosonic-acid transferase